MATKLYLRNVANSLSGTFPTGEQSALAPTVTATGANTLLTLSDTKGSAQTFRSFNTNATTTAQSAFIGFWCSQPLAAQTLSTTFNFNGARLESNLNSNFILGGNVYVWRPSTGAKVQGEDDVNSGLDWGTENTSANVKQSSANSGNISFPNTSVSAGDVIIVEVWRARKSQAMGTSYSNTFYWDGTTEELGQDVTVTDHASFIEFSQNITFQGAPVELNAAPDSYSVTGSSATLLRTYTPENAATGSYSFTGANATLSRGYVLSATAGSYTLSGNNETDIIARGVFALPGNYNITGIAAILAAQRNLNAQTGSYNITGNDINIIIARGLSASPGIYSITGNDVTTLRDIVLLAGPGSYSLNGIDATLIYTPISSVELNAEPGSYEVIGNVTNLLRTYLLEAGPGSYAISGIDATTIYSGSGAVVEIISHNYGFGLGPVGKVRTHPHPVFSRTKQ